MKAVKQAEKQLYQRETRYRGGGVIAGEIACASSRTPDFFGLVQNDARQVRLMLTAAGINHKTATARCACWPRALPETAAANSVSAIRCCL